MVSDNEVRFTANKKVETDNTIIKGRFVVADRYVTPGKDHNIDIGSEYWFDTYNPDPEGFHFNADRSGSGDTADWWNRNIDSSSTTFDHGAGELNFAIKGTLTLWVQGSPYKEGQTLKFPNTFLAQGHAGMSNNWWFGITGATQVESIVRYNSIKATDSTGNYQIEFQRGGDGDDDNEIYVLL